MHVFPIRMGIQSSHPTDDIIPSSLNIKLRPTAFRFSSSKPVSVILACRHPHTKHGEKHKAVILTCTTNLGITLTVYNEEIEYAAQIDAEQLGQVTDLLRQWDEMSTNDVQTTTGIDMNGLYC